MYIKQALTAATYSIAAVAGNSTILVHIIHSVVTQV